VEENRASPNPQDSDSNILIAYFTWADNTVVENQNAALCSALIHYESMSDSDIKVDAIASASIVAPRKCSTDSWVDSEENWRRFVLHSSGRTVPK